MSHVITTDSIYICICTCMHIVKIDIYVTKLVEKSFEMELGVMGGVRSGRKVEMVHI